ncbi:neutral/alkaline non-lysosomal ceramidase N-terminal domain-containing protein [Microbacterium sp. H1-D42]|uniref:neutral/alkaline non-lysosomal ceramidase N-terminal domain-containing protein n=1 Tax=Microbacterium sp. H1-D42 TaxID=2925844 RepID=UPI001F52BAF7|nr:neutral/alkaline non-lysosomal ceramidase N-terminal domain-containing protein [Microbacterium sp. H1-D42]UNK70759.1 neutral/alkaline non-lysosomal ceramidase N-terminal domain-containing protein [Microbacterium sp. H1-D42]
MSDAGMLRVGAAVRTVEVPTGTAMSGFAARTSGSTGVRDALSVRALVLERIAIVAVDCCMLHEDTCTAVRAAVRAEGAVDEVVVHATHTHSGPCIALGRAGVDDAQLRRAVEVAVPQAVAAAAAGLLPCTISVSEARGAGVAHDRRHSGRRIDPPVQAIGFDHQGRRIATLVSFACHPVVLDAANTQISADFPASLRDAIERAHPDSVCVYATGTAGDVNPGDFSPESSFVAGSGRGFADATRIGEHLAGAVLAAPARDLAATEVSFSTTPVELAVTPEVDVADRVREWRAELDGGTERAALLQEWLRWAESTSKPTPESAATTWSTRVSVIGVGDLRIVALPGEPFLAASDLLRAHHGGPLVVLGYCDGVAGYLPDAAEYAHGGYEVDDAHRYYAMPGPFARGSLERVTDAAAALLAG